MKTLNTLVNIIFGTALLTCLLALSLYNWANSQVFAFLYLSVVCVIGLYTNYSINKLK